MSSPTNLYSFAADLYKTLTNNETEFKENCFFSPVSIYAAFASLMAGTGGNSKAELLKLLHVNNKTDLATLHSIIGKELNELITSSVDTKITMGNRIFIDNKFEINQSFTKLVKDCYTSEPETVNFSSEAEKSREKINTWVAQKTENKIKNLFSSDAINSDTKFVIANALYFKGLWNKPFDKTNTHDETFKLLDGTTKKVPMMFLKEKNMGYTEFESMDAQAIFLPFKNSQMNMFILLPNDLKGLPSLMKKLFEDGDSRNGKKQMNLKMFLSTANYGNDEVELSLPRFKIGGEPSLNLKSTLMAMGVLDIFTPGKANFNAITDAANLVVSDVVHQAVLEVDEEGAVAAAATGIGIMMMCMPMPPQKMIVDHPFVVAIADDKHTPLFLGHVSNPN